MKYGGGKGKGGTATARGTVYSFTEEVAANN